MLQEIKNLVEAELDFTPEGFGRVEGVVGSEDDIGIASKSIMILAFSDWRA